MKKYEIDNFDYGCSYILHFEDDSWAMVNTELETITYDDPESLMTMGFWADDAMEPVSDEIRAKIDSIVAYHSSKVFS